MSLSTLTDVSVHPRVKALKEKHQELSQQIDDAQKALYKSDYDLSQLKKEKLLVKEKIAEQERCVANT